MVIEGVWADNAIQDANLSIYGDLAVVPEDVGSSAEVQHPIDDQLTIAS